MTASIVERPASALRQRLLEDMAMRGLRSDTQRDCIRVVRSFAAKSAETFLVLVCCLPY
jgi:integrase/recombinase XerD